MSLVAIRPRNAAKPEKGGMTERNRARLRPFDDPVNVERLVNLPEKLARTVARDEPSCSNAIQIQSAVAIALEAWIYDNVP